MIENLILDQASSLRNAFSMPPVKIIAVTAGKGGVGKTNVCLNLAITLAQMKNKVMILDADLGLANIDVLLGIQSRYNLSHFIKGEKTLSEILVDGPAGIKIVPAASGVRGLADLNYESYAGLVGGFSQFSEKIDYLFIDTAAGISESVLQFNRAAHEIILVLTDEPTSLTDAYAMIKVLSTDHQKYRFHILTNMVSSKQEGRILFQKLNAATEKFLDQSLLYLGAISYDELLKKSVKQQNPVVLTYPNSPSSRDFKKYAKEISQWSFPFKMPGQTTFFMERFIEQI